MHKDYSQRGEEVIRSSMMMKMHEESSRRKERPSTVQQKTMSTDLRHAKLVLACIEVHLDILLSAGA